MSIYDEVRLERERAHAKHGAKSCEAWPADDPIRLAILTEETGEVARVFNEACLADAELDLDQLRAELIQVAAVAIAWADKIDLERAGPVDDMARRLAEKMGDPRPTFGERIKASLERPLDLDVLRGDAPAPRPEPAIPRDVIDWWATEYGRTPSTAEHYRVGYVMSLTNGDLLDQLEDGRLNETDPAVRYRLRHVERTFDVTPE